MVLTFRFGHWKCLNQEYGKDHFHFLKLNSGIQKRKMGLIRLASLSEMIEALLFLKTMDKSKVCVPSNAYTLLYSVHLI